MPKMTIGDVIAMHDANDDWREFQVDYPEDRCGPWSIEHFEVAPWDKGRIRLIRKEGPERDPGRGTFRKLVETVPGAGKEGADLRTVWMSDTRAEIKEHAPVLLRMQNRKPSRVLINGLGLGLVVRAASRIADHVDVVECNQDIVSMVGKYMPANVQIHMGDAYDIKWPKGAHWGAVWHDIWPQITDENIPGMKELLRKYRNMTDWQDCWQWSGCYKMWKMMRDMENGTLDPAVALQFICGEFRP